MDADLASLEIDLGSGADPAEYTVTIDEGREIASQITRRLLVNAGHQHAHVYCGEDDLKNDVAPLADPRATCGTRVARRLGAAVKAIPREP